MKKYTLRNMANDAKLVYSNGKFKNVVEMFVDIKLFALVIGGSREGIRFVKLQSPIKDFIARGDDLRRLVWQNQKNI